MWIARDKDGTLCIYYYKPIRNEGVSLWLFSSIPHIRTTLILRSELFPEVTWESEPKWKRILDLDWIEHKKTYKCDIENFLSN